jgi:hypothetical protein
MLMKPGPAISTRATSAFAGNASTISCASARGLLRAGLASAIAMLVAKSPCSRVLVRSTAMVGMTRSAGSVPDARSVSVAEISNALQCIFHGKVQQVFGGIV